MDDRFIIKGKEVAIRPVKLRDAEALIALKKDYINGTATIPMYDYEYTNTIKQEEDWINTFITRPNSALLVAECNGSLIGNIDLAGSQRQKMYHTGMIGMGVANAWQNKKIGSMLMEAVLNRALQSPLQIIWLEVYAINMGGIRLYEKFGFERCGLIKDFFKEGLPVDKITIVKYLHD